MCGRGLGRLFAAWLERAGLGAKDGTVAGRLWISDRWQAEIEAGGERRADEAAWGQAHHLLFRLTEFAARKLGGELPIAVNGVFEDLRTDSPGALLAYCAGWGEEGAERLRRWRRAFELDPRLAAVRTELARVALGRGDGTAAASLLAGVGLHDAAAAAELGIGIWAAAGGAADEDDAWAETAIRLLHSAVQADTQDAVAAAALAALLARRGASGPALDEARLLASHSTQVAPDDYRCWAALADVVRAAGDFKDAAFYYATALKLQPEATGVLKDAAACWLLAEQPAQALPLIERALALDPRDAENYGNLALARQALGETAGAAEAARKAAELNPDHPRLRALAAELAASGAAS
ncbi:MAG TPA: hypothetical protein VN515_01945 [Terriglobales bacterium]|nr:hypothetical protein [Terriglobales bacterium]